MKSALLFPLLLVPISAQNNTGSGVPVTIVITAEPHHAATVPALADGDVMIYQNKARRRVTSLVPCSGDRAALQLFILLDDGLDTAIGTQLDDIRQLIRAQPATTQIGIGYMRNGMTQIVRDLGSDHEQAAKALRLPTGPAGESSSPYIALSELIRKWPASQDRREVLMITSGVDLYNEPGPDNPYLRTAIEQAQKAAIVVHSIYYPGAGHAGHSYWRINWGQNYLSQLADETGGEAFWQGLSSPVSLAPFLRDLTERLEHQYLATFLAAPSKKPAFEPIHIATELSKLTLIGPMKVYVPAH